MRIGLVSMHTSPVAPPGRGDAGGMNVVVRALGDELARAGHEVELLTRAASVDEAGRVDVLDSGALVRFLPAGAPGPVVKEQLPAVTGAFERMLRALPRFDVLHAHYWLSGVAALPAARAAGSAFVQSFHTVGAVKNANLAPGDTPEPVARLQAEAMLAGAADAVVAATASEAAVLEPGRVAVIPPGVDTRLFHPRAPGDGAPAERPRLLVIGRLQPLKGQDLTIRALARLDPATRPLLQIVGEASGAHGAAYRDRLLDLVARLGLAREVRLVGACSREQVAELLRAATLVAVPSRSESFGLVALEAAASGVPIVAARAPGLVDSVRDGVTGVLVDGRDERAWAATIERMLRDDALRRAMGAASVVHASGYSWHAAASRLAKLYESVLESI